MKIKKAAHEEEQNQILQTPVGQDMRAIADKVTTSKDIDYEKYYVELNSAGVTLDEDPVEYGLTNLNVKIAQIDGQKNRVSFILTLAIKNENDIDQICAFIDRAYKKHAANTLLKPEIADLANQGLRDAAVLKELKDLVDQHSDMQRCLSEAKTFTKIVRQTFETLDSTNKNISRQLTTVQAMIDLGEVFKRTN